MDFKKTGMHLTFMEAGPVWNTVGFKDLVFNFFPVLKDTLWNNYSILEPKFDVSVCDSLDS